MCGVMEVKCWKKKVAKNSVSSRWFKEGDDNGKELPVEGGGKEAGVQAGRHEDVGAAGTWKRG